MNFWKIFLMHAPGNKRKVAFHILILFGIFSIGIFLLHYIIPLRSLFALPVEKISTTQTAIADEIIIPTSTSSPTARENLLPTGTPMPQVCSETRGRIEYREFVTEVLPYPMACRVYLPPCYDFDQDAHYPVLVIMHGQSSNDDQWDLMGLDETADSLIVEGEILPLIIVMPHEMNTLADDKESQFGEAVAEALIPWVDEEYRTDARRECRALGGLSRGAAWAMRIGLTNWELFGEIGAHSFAPFSGDFYMVPYWLQKIPADQLPRIYMDMGTLDFMLTAAGLFEDRLTKYHVPHEWIINNGTHNEEYWSGHLQDYLLWYTFPWQDQCGMNENPAVTSQ
jgi:enterochelin esterase-like enzyme